MTKHTRASDTQTHTHTHTHKTHTHTTQVLNIEHAQYTGKWAHTQIYNAAQHTQCKQCMHNDHTTQVYAQFTRNRSQHDTSVSTLPWPS